MSCQNCHNPFVITCDAGAGKGPYSVNLPYPTVQVMCENPYYASILSNDFAGKVSELSAITQYVNHEIRLTPFCCEIAQTLMGIAQVEMHHLQMIGEMIVLLGGDLKYEAYHDFCEIPWSGDFVDYGTNLKEMIELDIEAEKAAIQQYRQHICEIYDCHIRATLQRIIMDEEFHIKILTRILACF